MEPFQHVLSLALLLFTLSTMGAWVMRLVRVESTAPLLNPLFGWALLTFLALVLGCFNSFGVMGAAVIFFGLALLLALKLFSRKIKFQEQIPIDLLVAMLIGVPLLFGVGGILPHAWDDFSHWLPNANYLFKRGGFPTPHSPIASTWPVYPYGFSLLIASLGWFSGAFVESAGPLLNTALLMIFTLFLAKRLEPEKVSFKNHLKVFGGLFLALIFINPGFNDFLLFSSYSDAPTAVLLALLAWMGLDLFKGAPREPAIRFALVALVFVQVRQANIYLLIILAVALLLAHRDQLKDKLLPFAYMLLPAVGATALWHFYAGQFDAKGFAVATAWRWDLLHPLLTAMADVVMRKSGYFLLLIGVAIWGFTRAFKKEPQDRLLTVTALVIAGYSAFLLLAYMGSNFSENEIRNAASFFRYTYHLHLLVIGAFLVAGLPYVQVQLAKRPKLLAVSGTLFLFAIPVLGGLAAGYKWLPQPSAEVTAVRSFAHGILPAMRPDANVGILIPGFDGVEASIIAYEWAVMPAKTKPAITGRYTRFEAEKAAQTPIDFARARDAVIVGPLDTAAWQSMGRTPENRWVAFLRSGDAWTMITPQLETIP